MFRATCFQPRVDQSSGPSWISALKTPHAAPASLAGHRNAVGTATAQAAAMGTIRPGVTRSAKPREPAPIAIAIFATALLVIAARIGNTASSGVVFAAATKEATETAAACVSTKPATTA